AYYLALAERAEPELFGPQQGAWLERLEWEHDNLRAALQWALETREWEAGLRLGGGLGRFLDGRGYYSEGRERVGAFLNAAGGEAAGSLACVQGDWARARALLQETLAIRQELGDERGVAATLDSLGAVTYGEGDYGATRAMNAQKLAIYRKLNDRPGIAVALS